MLSFPQKIVCSEDVPLRCVKRPSESRSDSAGELRIPGAAHDRHGQSHPERRRPRRPLHRRRRRRRSRCDGGNSLGTEVSAGEKSSVGQV